MPVAGEDLSSGIPTIVPTLWSVVGKWYTLGRDGFLFHGGYSAMHAQASTHLLSYAQLGRTKATDCLTWGLDGLLRIYTFTLCLT